MFFTKFFQNIDLTPGEERGDDFKGGILGSGSDKGNNAFFHSAQQSILLGFAKAMDLIDEEERAILTLFGSGNDITHIFNSGTDCA